MQPSTPLTNPSDAHDAPPSAVPSHVSAESIAPFPHRVHAVVSSMQSAPHASVPVTKPSVAQVDGPSAVPSHSSPASITPLPQATQPLSSKVVHPASQAS